MEHYRVAVGISPPFRIWSRAKRRSKSHSARSMPGALPSAVQAAKSIFRRSPSAPPVSHRQGTSRDRPSVQFGIRPHSSAEKAKIGVRGEDINSITIEVPTGEMLGSRIASKATSAISG